MAFNPLSLIQLKQKFQIFRKDHPNMPVFGKALKRSALKVGCQYRLTVTTLDGEVLEDGITLTENDVEMIRIFVN
ncbi:MAG: hypothetical protein IKG70_04550 [Lachnospiraceae bacterium]|nr:hypothetical protein [Lachnospiraceae bacterium]